jgi:hypothetical protein
MSNQKKHISDVREALFKVLDGLTNTDNPMDIERARAVNETAQVIINSAKVEVDFLKVVHGDGEVPFITGATEEEPVPQQTALPSAPSDPLARGPAPNHPWRATVHKLKG